MSSPQPRTSAKRSDMWPTITELCWTSISEYVAEAEQCWRLFLGVYRDLCVNSNPIASGKVGNSNASVKTSQYWPQACSMFIKSTVFWLRIIVDIYNLALYRSVVLMDSPLQYKKTSKRKLKLKAKIHPNQTRTKHSNRRSWKCPLLQIWESKSSLVSVLWVRSSQLKCMQRKDMSHFTQ